MLKGMMKKLISIGCLVTMAVFLAGCAGNSKSQTGESADKSSTASQGDKASDDSDEIKIAVVAWNPCMFLNLADELGYFKEAGVKVKLINFEEYTDVPSAFSAGHLDGAFYSSFEVLPPASSGTDIKVVAVTDKSNGADAIVASKDNKTLKDLVGKKIGIGFNSIEYFYFMRTIQEAGFKMDDFKFVDMNPSTASNAMIAGQIDATAIFEPFVTSIINGTGGNIITDTSKTPDLISDCITFSGKSLKEHHDDIVKVMKAYYKAIDYYNNNTDKAVEIMAKDMGDTPENFKATMKKLKMLDGKESHDFLSGKDSNNSWSSNEGIMMKNLIEKGELKSEVDLKSIIDTTVVADANK